MYRPTLCVTCRHIEMSGCLTNYLKEARTCLSLYGIAFRPTVNEPISGPIWTSQAPVIINEECLKWS